MEIITEHDSFLESLGFKSIGNDNRKYVFGIYVIGVVAPRHENDRGKTVILRRALKADGTSYMDVAYKGSYIFDDEQFARTQLLKTGFINYADKIKGEMRMIVDKTDLAATEKILNSY